MPAQNRFMDSAPCNDKAERIVSDAVHAATHNKHAGKIQDMLDFCWWPSICGFMARSGQQGS